MQDPKAGGPQVLGLKGSCGRCGSCDHRVAELGGDRAGSCWTHRPWEFCFEQKTEREPRQGPDESDVARFTPSQDAFSTWEGRGGGGPRRSRHTGPGCATFCENQQLKREKIREPKGKAIPAGRQARNRFEQCRSFVGFLPSVPSTA